MARRVQGALCRQAEAALAEAEQVDRPHAREQVLDGLLALVTVDAQRLPAPAAWTAPACRARTRPC
jgi:hypothetical protein